MQGDEAEGCGGELGGVFGCEEAADCVACCGGGFGFGGWVGGGCGDVGSEGGGEDCCC